MLLGEIGCGVPPNTQERKMEKPSPESFRLLTISAEKLPASMGHQGRISEYATQRAKLLLGCYRTGDANDPETYVAAIAATLARYSEQIITDVTHPCTGLPSQKSWLPTVKEVFDACETEDNKNRQQLARESRIRDQIAAREEDDRLKAQKLTYEELRAKYGDNWGIENPDIAKRSPPDPAPNSDQLRHHYQHYGLAFKPKHQEDLEDHIERGFSPGSV
jgi:hypothetical protein